MSKFLSILAISLSLQAAVPVVSNITIDPLGRDATSLRLFWDTNIAYTDYRVRISTSSCSAGTGGITDTHGLFFQTILFQQAFSISRLTPSTLYYFCPESTTDGVTYSTGAEISYTTPAATGPTAPTAPAIMSVTFPAQSGSTLTVASNCSDLQTKINAAAYGDTIEIPVGTVCSTPVTLPTPAAAKTFAPSAVHTSDDTIHYVGHGYSTNDKVHLSSTGCMPGSDIWAYGTISCARSGGLLKGVDYFVIRTDADNFKLSLTSSGPAAPFGFVNLTSIDTSGDTLTIIGGWQASIGYQIFDSGGQAIAMQFKCSAACPGGISQNTNYWPITNCTTFVQTCTFQITATQFSGVPVNITGSLGGTVTIVTQGTGTHYIMAWPQADSWKVIQSAGANTSLPAEGIRIDPTYQPVMASFKQATYLRTAPFLITGSPLADHWRIRGLEFTAVANNDASVATNVRGTSNYLIFGPDNSYICIEQNYIHGLGFPQRFGPVPFYMDGNNVCTDSNYMEKMDYWHSVSYPDTITYASTSSTATVHQGYIAYLNCKLTTTSDIVLNVSNGGGITGTGWLYWNPDCSMTWNLPNGITASSSGGGVTTHVINSASPAVPTVTLDGQVVRASEVFGQINFVAGNVDTYGLLPFYAANKGEATEGCQCWLSGGGPGPYRVSNNYISGTGILIHFDDNNGAGAYQPHADYYVVGNTWHTPLDQLFCEPASTVCRPALSNGLRYGHRQPFEWKSGLRLWIEGNTCDTWAEDTRTAPCFTALTARNGGWITDVTIKNNKQLYGGLVYEGCTSIIDSTGPAARPCQRQLMQNNYYTNLNGLLYNSSASAPPEPGFVATIGGPHSDFVMDHNSLVYTTDITPSGYIPTFMHFELEGGSFWRVTNNLIHIPLGIGGGVTNDGVKNCPSNADAAFVACAMPGSIFANNVTLPSYVDPSVPSGQVDPATLCPGYGGTWTGTVCNGGVFGNMQTGATVPLRLAALKLSTQFSGMFNFNSPWVHTGTNSDPYSSVARTTDPGVDFVTLDRGLGVIHTGSALAISSTSVTFKPIVPTSGTSCYVGYGTSPTSLTWSAANTASSFNRVITITGLSPHTFYYGQIACKGTAQFPVSFATN